MKTLKQLVVDLKCRKGDSHAKNKNGAFWLALPEIQIRSYGGDGIGNSGADCTVHLQLRHYRSGAVDAVAHFHSWHQNWHSEDAYRSVGILDCSTVEDVICELFKSKFDDGDAVYSPSFEGSLSTALSAIGMTLAEPAPDEQQPVGGAVDL